MKWRFAPLGWLWRSQPAPRRAKSGRHPRLHRLQREPSGLAEFETLLKAFLIELKARRYNGTSAPKIVLVSPTAAEKPHEHLNTQIKLYTEAIKNVAKAEGVAFVDVSRSEGLE